MMSDEIILNADLRVRLVQTRLEKLDEKVLWFLPSSMEMKKKLRILKLS